MPARVTEQGSAWFNVFGEIRAGERKAFNVQQYGATPGVGGNLGGQNDGAFQAAIEAASQFAAASANGASVLIPDYFEISTTLKRPSANNVSLVGVPAAPSGAAYPVSGIKLLDNTKPVLDLGNNAVSGVMLESLGIYGSGGTDLNHRGITAQNTSRLKMRNCMLDLFGGSAIRIDAGLDNWFRELLIINSLLGYGSLAAYAGALELGCSETFGYDCNINGNLTHGTQGQFGSGWQCAAYFKNSQQHWFRTTFAHGQQGVVVTTGTVAHSFIGNRFEFNQGNGLLFDGKESIILGNRAQDNSQGANDTYAGFKIGSGGATGISVVVIGNRVDSVSYPTFKHSYGFELRPGGGTGLSLAGEYYANGGSGYVRSLYDTTNVVAPVFISPKLWQQTLTDGASIDINAEAGDICFVQCAATPRTINAPTNARKNQVLYLDLRNASGGALAVTWNAVFKGSGGATIPATGNRRIYTWQYDGTNWILVAQSPADIGY